MEHTNKKLFTPALLTRCGILIAIVAIMAQISIPLPVSPVPISLQSLALLLVAAILPPVASAFTVTAYLLLGAVGVPIFAGFGAGLPKLVGPTGGFLAGFLPATILLSYLLRHKAFQKLWTKILAVLVFHIILYGLGCLWFVYSLKTTWVAALMACVVPFLIGDTLKSVAFFLVSPKIQKSIAL